MNKEQLIRLNPPELPGVYIMHDQNEKIIYVGKAVLLRKRLLSYFRPAEQLDLKTNALMEKVVRIEWLVADRETEALILEQNLIRKHQPRYNILLRDDKSFPYLKLTVAEPFPQLSSTRKPFKDAARYFGPFAIGSLKAIVRLISKEYRLCQIQHALKISKPLKRQCLYYQMGQCDGACLGKITSEAYAAHVNRVLLFLEGKEDTISPQLEKEMYQAALDQQFEDAAEMRDQLEIIRKLKHQSAVRSLEQDDYDLIGLARSGASAAVELFQVRKGRLEGRRQFRIQAMQSAFASELISQIISQYYSQPVELPGRIIVPEIPDDESILIKWLGDLSGRPIVIEFAKTPGILQLQKMAEKNAWLFLRNADVSVVGELSEMDQRNLTELANAIGMERLPLRIEGYDISNISGQDAVGSQVVFLNGHPLKSAYRHYKIKTIAGPNDFAMLQEVLFRRFKQKMGHELEKPDLVLVDGGAGQVSAAWEVMRDLNLSEITLIGLAKRAEEIFLPHLSNPIILSHASGALKILMRLRDEAHRFAITFHRQLRSKRMRASVLDGIEGVGPQKKQQLLKTFGSVEALLQVTEEELANEKGIGIELAKTIQNYLRKKL